jgi:hypothetical protein
MERVLFYSGHGAELPMYNATGEVDHVDECLVPYDFAWTKETAITDDDFYHLYVDLPYKARFFAIFDCCHSGGMTRDGTRKIRGITPPDDIRHRMLRWNAKEQMWQERKLPQLNRNFGGTESEKEEFMGVDHATLRLGRAMRLRTISQAMYSRLAKTDCPPYLPVLLEACRQDQLSYEYRYGTTSYGAFTYTFAKDLRLQPRSTFQQIIARTAVSLKDLGYDQSPQLVGPDSVVSKPIPAAARVGPRRRRRQRR